VNATATRDLLEGWPRKGYDGPQPWEHDELGISREDREQIGTKPNTVTPVITHNHPILTSGSAHPSVHELGRKLGDLGFPNSVSKGENAFGTVDQSVLAAIDTFRSQYGVHPDPSAFGGNTPGGRALAAAHVDPWTVEAILRAWNAEYER
jgi:alkanesulfonate monooxygenase SsuD/methylene tetrahydromethanopterin reductase-like flavin-dependent oxidoreductase (luciferase family)